MSSKTNTWNAYESRLGTGLLAGSNSVLVNDTAQSGLVAPFYMVLEPDVPARREWIKVLTVTATAFENIVRGLEGSAGPLGVGVDHAVDSVVRAVFTKQLQDDLFHDIEATAGVVAQNVSDIAANVSGIAQNVTDIQGNAGDIATIQSTYLPLTGGTLTGPLEATDISTNRINAANPGNDLHIRDGDGITTAFWDDSADKWVFVKPITAPNEGIVALRNDSAGVVYATKASGLVTLSVQANSSAGVTLFNIPAEYRPGGGDIYVTASWLASNGVPYTNKVGVYRIRSNGDIFRASPGTIAAGETLRFSATYVIGAAGV